MLKVQNITLMLAGPGIAPGTLGDEPYMILFHHPAPYYFYISEAGLAPAPRRL
jgi:hypothetical protein